MKILVVEDDKKIAKFLKRGLEEEGYEVDVAHDGEDVRIGGQRIGGQISTINYFCQRLRSNPCVTLA